MLVPSFLVTTLLVLEGAEAIAYWLLGNLTEYEQIRGGGAKISWAQGCKVPKYGPACTFL
jgi:hypothetical protein